MNYLQNKRHRKNSPAIIFFGLTLLMLILSAAWLRHALMPLALPFWRLSSLAEDSFLNIFPFLRTQKKLVAENEELKRRLEETENQVLVKESVLKQNIELKILLGREERLPKTVLAAVLVRPAKSIYDELMIEAGSEGGVSKGDMVLDQDDIALGKIEEAYPEVSKVRLYSAPGVETEVQIGDEGLVATLKGRGGGNYYLELPREVGITEGDEALLPGSKVRLLAQTRKIEKEESGSIQRVYLKSPVNIFNLKWVRVLPSTLP